MKYPHLRQGIAYEWRRIRRQGLARLPLKIAKHGVRLMLWLVLLPVTIVLHLAGFRRLTVFTERIGHLAIEPDCLLKEQALGLIPKRRWFMLAPSRRVANRHLLNYWKPLIRVYEHGTVCFVLDTMSSFRLMRYDTFKYLRPARSPWSAYQIYSRWTGRPPLLCLTPADTQWAQGALRGLGLPDSAWFVCVHVREGGFSPVDEELQAHRNGNIEATIPAMEEIARQGGWVIRIGDSSMRRLPPLPQVIDYAHHPMKSDRLDVVLCARARFILGNTSGIALVGSVFGVPCATINVIPTTNLWYNPHDVCIPKLLWSLQLNRYLRFDEIFGSRIARLRYASMYSEAGIRVDENSADDVTDLVEEMIQRLDDTFVETPDDVGRAERFRSYLPSDHCAADSCARAGSYFLRKHSDLLRS